MLVLALDTTTARAAASPSCRDGACWTRSPATRRGPHAERLPGDLLALLERHGLRPPDVDVFAVATGPGSFTGLRIGIAAIQGLAFATGRPVVGVSALEALAHAAVGSAARRDAGRASASGWMPSATRCSRRSTTAAGRGPHAA